MHRLPTLVLSTVALAAFAQAQVAPGEISPSTASTVFTSGTGGNVPGQGFGQINLLRLPGDAPGTWTACLTMLSGLPAANGGVGSYDLLMGKYDAVNGTFTPNLEAAALNSSGVEFGLMLDTTGLHAVFDRATGVFYANRANPTANFGAPVQVTGITGTYVDPALGYVGKQLMIFYAANNDLVMQPLDISNPAAPKVTGTATVVVKSTGGTLNSPTPITGPDGDVEGLWHATLTSSDNDMCWANSLNPADGFVVVVDTTTWINNGGVAGGTLFHAGPNNATYSAFELDVAWMLGDEVQPGGTVDLFGAFPRQKNAPGVTAVFLSGGLLPNPVTVPGFGGQLAIDVVTLSYLGAMAHPDASDRGSLSFGIPKDTGLIGATVRCQGVSVDPSTLTATLTNDAIIRVVK